MRVAAQLVAAVLIGAASAAPAAELPRLGACGLAGGGFILPGTDGCLRIGGFARAEAAWTTASQVHALQAPAAPRALTPAASLGRSAIGADARLSADLRLPTEFGPVRAYVSLRSRDGISTGPRGR